jgi:predicted DNA-binding protein (UPF0251 family)
MTNTMMRADGLFGHLNTEWTALCGSASVRAEVAGWGADAPIFAGVRSLGAVAALHAERPDGVLAALVCLYQNGSRLAGRTLTQLMLGKLVLLTRYARVAGHDRSWSFDERAATTVAAFLGVAESYKATTGGVFAGLALRTLGAITSAPMFAEELTVDPADLGPLAENGDNTSAADDSAETVLSWAQARGAISAAERELIELAWLERPDADLAEIAAEMGIGHAALRQRLSRAVGKVRDAVVAAHQPGRITTKNGRRAPGRMPVRAAGSVPGRAPACTSATPATASHAAPVGAPAPRDLSAGVPA